MLSIQANLLQLEARLRALEKQYQRSPHSVKLLAISKNQPCEKIQAAHVAGQRAFGENYLQEALGKIEQLAPLNLEWHFTGTIQSNKTRHLAAHFSWVHTLTEEKIAQRLNDQRPAHLAPLNVCLEVKVSFESTKSGLSDFAALKKLATFCQTLPRLKLRGLMTIPAPESDLAKQRAALKPLADLKAQLIAAGFELDTLSMGMTADLEAAVAEGATFIRIGRGIFGSRT